MDGKNSLKCPCGLGNEVKVTDVVCKSEVAIFIYIVFILVRLAGTVALERGKVTHVLILGLIQNYCHINITILVQLALK